LNVILDANNDQGNESFSLYRDSTQYLGQQPAVRFQLDGGGSWINTGGSFIVGSDFLPPAVAITDTLMFFDNLKGAFRAGILSDSDSWAPGNIGKGSFASGEDTKASGLWSTAMGDRTTASAHYSTAMGSATVASGNYSTAMGSATNASGNNSTAMGDNTNATGINSTAIGAYSKAKGFASTVIGMYNDSILTVDQMVISPTTPLFIVGNGDDNNIRTNAMVVNKNGRVGLGLNLPGHPIHHVSGARLTAAGVWTNASDKRLKSQIEPISYGLNEVMKLTPSKYIVNTTGEKSIGFIAQELKEIIPEVVSGTEGDIKNGETLGVSYGNLIAVLTKAIQEQQMIINDREFRIKELETEIKKMRVLESKVNALELLMSVSKEQVVRD
jgi:hypothetical protein